MAILAGPHLVLNLLLERQDDKEEVVKDHPREDAADGGDMATDQEDEVVDDVQDEADSSQHDPRFHEAGVPRSGAMYEAGGNDGGKDEKDQHEHTNYGES